MPSSPNPCTDAMPDAAALPADLQALDQQAWAQQYRRPLQAAQLARRLAALAPPGSAMAAQGLFHLAWAELRWGDPDTARQAHATLRAAVAAGAGVCAEAAERDLAAAWLRREGRFADALALAEANLALPEALRTPHAQAVTATGAAICCSALHRLDDALRHFHRAQAHAEASGDEALRANAGCNLGGAHYDVHNLEDAEHHCRSAFEAAARSGAQGSWVTAGINLLLVLTARGEPGEPGRLAATLLGSETLMRPDKRAKYATVLADALRLEGQGARAQALLDEAEARRGDGAVPPLEWVHVQAALLLERGEPAAALDLVQQRLVTSTAPNEDDLPLTVLRLQQHAAEAAERLGDLTGALVWQRAALASHEALVGRSARARRVALEVEHELAAARRARDEAERERGRLATLAEALAEANRAKSRFLAAASHDLRQPVHALALQVAALRGELATPRQVQMVARIERCVAALGGLFGGLLDLSRIDAGVVEPRRHVVSLAPLLATLVEQHLDEAHRQGLRLALHLPRGMASPCTHSDAMLLERMLRNLLVNALRYTPQGGVLVAVRARGAQWRIEVRDSGVGIAPAEQRHVFDEFVQLGERDAARDGLGLGLAIVQRLAGVLGHGLGLRSAPGRGSCFWIELPRVVAAAAPLPDATGAAPLPLNWPVLVIDDDPEIRGALADLLRQWGLEPQVTDALAGCQLPPGWRPQAALVDHRLRGGREGPQEVAELRERFGAGLPCLVVTGETNPAVLRRLTAAGLPWAAKPLSPLALRRWLAAAAAAAGGAYLVP